MATPIKPEDLKNDIPDYVIEAVNKLLSSRFPTQGNSITLLQEEIVEKILEMGPEDLDRTTIFANGYLNFEKLYEEFGWDVKYVKPDYTENFKQYFRFNPRKKLII